MKIGIMGALVEEVQYLAENMQAPKKQEISGQTFYAGKLNDVDCVVAHLGDFGKVAAAACVQTLILVFKVDKVIFTGVAGAVDPNLNIGDVVVCKKAIQHDFLISEGVLEFTSGMGLPSYGAKQLAADQELLGFTYEAGQEYLSGDLTETIPQDALKDLGITKPKAILGTVLTGDQFIEDKEIVKKLRQRFPDGSCVEMEGAAVLHVCTMNKIPCIILRTISDKADEAASVDFPTFVTYLAPIYSFQIVTRILDQLT